MKFRAWLETNYSEGPFGNMMRTLPFLAAPFMQGDSQQQQQPVQQQQQQQQQQSNPLLNAIQQKYKIRLQPSQMKMIKPVDVIKPVYGNQWDSVYQKAKQAQSAQKINVGDDDDIEIPASNADAVTNVNKLEIPVPVIFADPVIFGQKKANGFCTSVVVNGKMQTFCVVKDEKMLHTIRHELSHATQDNTFSNSLAKDKNSKDTFSLYDMNEQELGVRLAEMKRNYYQLTGKLVTNRTFRDMIMHFMKNSQEYSPDVQQLVNTFNQANKEGSLSRLIIYLQDNVDKVVQNQPTTNQSYGRV